MQKIVLISSTITYIPDNYDSVLFNVVKKNKEKVSEVILIKISRLYILKNILLFFITGNFNFSFVLLKNLIRDLFGLKEKKLLENNIKVFKIKNFKDKNLLKYFRKNKADIFINMRGRLFLEDDFISLSKYGALNVHHGILPNQRGLMFDMRALAYGLEKGFSIHQVTKKIDDGKIFLIKKVQYNKDKRYFSYLSFLSNIESEVLSEFLFSLGETVLKKGLKNNFDKQDGAVYKNPTYKEILKMKKYGLTL